MKTRQNKSNKLMKKRKKSPRIRYKNVKAFEPSIARYNRLEATGGSQSQLISQPKGLFLDFSENLRYSCPYVISTRKMAKRDEILGYGSGAIGTVLLDSRRLMLHKRCSFRL